MVLIDASPLIHLARIRQLDLLKRIYGHALIGPAVYTETVEAGLAINAPDVHRLEVALTNGWLLAGRLASAENTLRHDILDRFRLGPGEAEAQPEPIQDV